MTILKWDKEQLSAAGLDPKKVQSIARRLSRLGREMNAIGLYVYGASGSGHLVHISRPTHTADGQHDYDASVANLDGACQWDGGDW